ncbi:DUF6297 family protein [Nonomuraea sp. NBC_01738]|uniref:DUF6297 family protein n=1 Tax=Nonomuraea sp. NBC_01738 TaxID=2976003 RepID=UPI002E163DD1|nr:DUF6297 family protein [Nonomuraea sp. NBC_01738]
MVKGWSDRYLTLYGLVMLAVVLGPPVAGALGGLARPADPVRLSAVLALLCAAFAGYLGLARKFGPMVVPAADAAWRLLSPLPRRLVLGRGALRLAIVGVLAGLVIGVALASVLGGGGEPLVRLGAALVIGVGLGLGGMALAVLGQSGPTWDGWLQAVIAAAVLAAVLVALFGAGPGRPLLAALTTAPAAVAGLVAAAGAVLVRQAWTALDKVPARAILASSTRAGTVAEATTMLDPAVLTWAAEDAHWRGRVLGTRRWPVRGAWVLAWQEIRRASRRPVFMGALAGATALPALAWRAELPVAAFALLLGGALTAAASMVAGARRDGGNPALLRLLGVGPGVARAVRALPPAVAGGVWLGVALAVLEASGASGGGLWALGVACGPALGAAALRMAGRRPIDHAMPVLDVGGPIPTGALMWALAGADLALLGCAPTLLALAAPEAVTGAGPWLATQVITGVVVLGGYLAARSFRAAWR